MEDIKDKLFLSLQFSSMQDFEADAVWFIIFLSR